ncbi:ROK family protein [Granulicella sp. dw_53]|uniref:ROK family protein n=1 Tax=Granulicella sp. dw_53 TaxID=2719792 RepID=UPI001BD5105E|nr:ROK family protein [Granulicella sp. dw_53]
MNPYLRSARSATIAALLQHERLSRSELAEITGVSPASITEVSQNFLQQGLLVELLLPQTGKRGRPSVQLRLQSSHSYFVGISISEVATLMVVTDLQGHILARQTIPFCKTPAEVTAAVRKNYTTLLRDAAIPRSRVRGVGIAVAGIVNSDLGICRYSAALNWRDVPISELIGTALKLPAWVDNDANAAAVGEKFFGRARDYLNFTSIILGRSIGSAHYMHGMLYRGHDGGAGEIGHITIDPKGALCHCGRNGCLETIAGGFALRAAAKACGLSINGMRDLEVLAVQGNTEASRLLRTAGATLGAGIAYLVHINNPQCILFTDMEGFENGVFRTAIRQTIENNILPRFLGSTQILFMDAEPGFLPRSAASIAAFEYLTSL